MAAEALADAIIFTGIGKYDMDQVKQNGRCPAVWPGTSFNSLVKDQRLLSYGLVVVGSQ